MPVAGSSCCGRCAGTRAGRCRGIDRHRVGSVWRRGAGGQHHGNGRFDKPRACGDIWPGGGIPRVGARAGRLQRAGRERTLPPARSPRCARGHRRNRPPRRLSDGWGSVRRGDGGRRRVPAARRFGQPRTGHRQPDGHSAAAEWAQLHHAGRTGAWRGAAAELVVAAHQRRPAPHQRVPLRRHLCAAARAGPGGILPEHRRHRGVQDRNEQSARRVRPLQWWRCQLNDEVRDQQRARNRLRVPAERSTQRAQLLRLDQSAEAEVPPQSVRRRARRSDQERPNILLRRLPGPAPDDWPHGDLHRPDRTAAAWHLQRSDRWERTGALRSRDNGRRCAHAVPGQYDSRESDRSGGESAAGPLPLADQQRHGQQLPARRRRNAEPGPVQSPA